MRHLLAFSAFLALAPAAGVLAQQPAEPAPPGQLAAAPATEGAASPGTAAPEAPAVELSPAQRTLAMCQACHTIEKGARTLIGPNLHGVFGRRAASIEGYRYSANMRELGETGHVWTEENIRRWITNPRAMLPKTAMRFAGISNEQQLNEFLPLLKEATGAP